MDIFSSLAEDIELDETGECIPARRDIFFLKAKSRRRSYPMAWKLRAIVKPEIDSVFVEDARLLDGSQLLGWDTR